MSKFFEWVGRNRKPISYTIGGLNLLAAVNFAIQGYHGMAVLWIAIAFMLIWDGYDSK